MICFPRRCHGETGVRFWDAVMGGRLYVSGTLSWENGCTFLGRCHGGTGVSFWDAVMGGRLYVSGMLSWGNGCTFPDAVMGGRLYVSGMLSWGTGVRFWDAVMGERLYVSGMLSWGTDVSFLGHVHVAWVFSLYCLSSIISEISRKLYLSITRIDQRIRITSVIQPCLMTHTYNTMYYVSLWNIILSIWMFIKDNIPLHILSYCKNSSWKGISTYCCDVMLWLRLLETCCPTRLLHIRRPNKFESFFISYVT